MNEDEDDKKTELPLGKETEANLFKSRSIFIYGGINQELAQRGLLAARGPVVRPATRTSGSSSIRGRPRRIGDSIHDMIKFVKP